MDGARSRAGSIPEGDPDERAHENAMGRDDQSRRQSQSEVGRPRIHRHTVGKDPDVVTYRIQKGISDLLDDGGLIGISVGS